MEALESIEVRRTWCEVHRDALRNLAHIHIYIDAPKRKVGSDEPDWVFRLRKGCFHSLAITKCEVSADGLPVIFQVINFISQNYLRDSLNSHLHCGVLILHCGVLISLS